LRRIRRPDLTHLRAHTAFVQLLGVVLCLPSLLFPSRVPGWAIWGSLVGLALLPVVGRLLAGRAILRTPVDIPILLLLLLLPLTLLVTPDLALTLIHVYKVIGSVALFYAVVGLLEVKPWLDLVALTISIAALGLAILVFLGTRWSTTKLLWFPFDIIQLLPDRVRFFWNPAGFNSNIAGGTLALLLPVPIAYLFFDRRRLIRIAALLEVGIVSLVLFLTQSRGAMSALLAGVAVMLVVHDRRWLLLGICMIVAGALVFQFVATSDLEDADSYIAAQNAINSMQGRVELWSRGVMMLQDFAFTGIGFGTVVKVMPLLYPTFVIPNDTAIEHVHNLYLEAGVDLGFPGLIATLAFLLGLFYISWRAARGARGKQLEPLASAMLGMVLIFAVHGLTDNFTFYAKAHLIVWGLFGVAVSVGMRLFHAHTPSSVALAPESA
jgi:hypothetical protein